ncbi:MAG TPA: ABC transporter permease [Bacillota bacterium]
MAKFITRRVLQAIPILIGISLLVFLMVKLVPGDPINAIVPPEKQSLVDLAAIRHQYGLDKPFLEQYLFMMKGIFTGSLVSFSQRVPAMTMIARTLPVTALLGVTSLIISLILGVALGAFVSRRPFGPADQTFSVLSLGGLSMPTFVSALILIYFLTEKLRLLPASGILPPGVQAWSLGGILPHMVMPVLTMSFGLLPEFYRFTRSSMFEVLSEDYVRTARAKGLAERTVFLVHALRNGLLPVLTMFGLNIPYVLGGSVVLESVFAIPGMGRLAITAAMARDYPLIITTNLIAAVLVIGSNLLTDILYGVADPRVKLH